MYQSLLLASPLRVSAGDQMTFGGYPVESRTIEKSCADCEDWIACVHLHMSKTQLSAPCSENRYHNVRRIGTTTIQAKVSHHRNISGGTLIGFGKLSVKSRPAPSI